MNTRLIYRPHPQPTEGLYGYLLRLAEGNGYDGIRYLCGDQLVTRQQLMQWLGLDTFQPLNRYEWQIDYPKNAFIQPWNHKSSRYCPECLQEHPIWKREWECTYFTVCPTHGRYLVGTCSVCDKPLTWKRRKLLACDCGAPLSAESQDAGREEIRLANAIISKVYYDRRPEQLLLRMTLTQLCQLIHVLGTYAHAENERFIQKVPNLANMEVALKLTRSAAQVYDGWPTAFYRMLERLSQACPNADGRPSISKQYGHLYTYVFTYMKDNEFRFVREAFEQHVVCTWLQPLTQRNKRISSEGRASGAWLPLSTAAKELGTSSNQLQLLFDAGLISLTAGKSASGRRVSYVERSMLPDIQYLLDDLVDQQTACAIIKLCKSRMLQLLKHRVVDALIVPQKRGAKWGVSRKSLQKLLDIGNTLPPQETESALSTVRLDFALQYWLHQDFLFPALIRAVSNREILPIGISRELEGIQGWIFDQEQLRQWCDDQIHEARNGAMTIPQVANELRLKQEVVYHLVKSNLLKVSDIKGRGGTTLITRDELHRFHNHYALSREFADMVGTSPSQATRMLDRYGLKPICGTKIDGCRQHVYLRGPQLIEALGTLRSK